jgi:hypothetical protein
MATLQERLQSDLENVESQLTKANSALSDILDSQLESYDLENMDTRQKAINLKIDKLEKLIESLERKREKIYGLLNGTIRCVSSRLRR